MTLPTVSKADPTPRYIQAERILSAAIHDGRLPAGCKLPSTQVISTMIDVSLITAHKALERLVSSGLLRREVGRGTFVCDDVAEAVAAQGQISIGLAIDAHVNLDDYYHAAIIDGLRKAARADSRPVEFFIMDLDAMNRVRVEEASGVICIHPRAEMRDEVARLARAVPLVVLGGTMSEERITCIDCDNLEGSRLAIRHLCGLGHKRIAVLSGPTNLSNAHDRAEGAREELQAQGIKRNNNTFLVSTDSVSLDEGAKGKLIKSLKGKNRVTAVFAGGFYLAMNVLQVIRSLKLRVPEDVSLIGFDDPVSAPLLDPPLTTVRQPLQTMAERGFLAISEILEKGNRKELSVDLPTELVIRGSTGPVN